MQEIIQDRYHVLEEIGIGGMGKVYKGLDKLTQQEVAIKSLKAELVSPEMIERFQREGQALRDLNHPNIVKMLDAIEDENQHYLIMEYVAGGDLRQLLLHETLSVERVLMLGIEIADALTRAHHLHIIHRDIKPGNVLIADDGTPRLTDFGVAHVANRERVTDSNSVVGTLDYLAPELFQRGAELDNRADIWAFGVMLFELLTGQKPFQGESFAELIFEILSGDIPDLEKMRPDVPVGLVDLIYRMMERDKNARMASVRLVGAGLEAILQGRDSRETNLPPVRFVTPTPDAFVRAKHNLPAQMTEFVGREAELQELSKLLDDRSVRLITILAPGGMGKTRLALELAERYVASRITESTGRGFGDGVYFVELAPLRDVSSIIPAIAEAIGYSLDEGDQKSQLLHYLSQKRLLLLLDNYEHLVEKGASLVSEILNNAPKVQIIVTSRQRLGQTGETLFHLSGMDVPIWKSPETAMNYAVTKLFMQGAKRVRPNFVLSDKNLKSVEQICRSVQGMPLAIVLSAAWLGVLSEDEIAQELKQGLDFLEAEGSNVPDRQRSIRAVFEYSWQMMSADEQAIFKKMSIFRGGFTREAVQEITGATLRTLMSLVNKSILRRDANSGRYAIHELLRQYAEERLQESAQELAETIQRHTEYYMDMLAAQRDILNVGSQKIQIIRDLNDDWDNIRAAWQEVIDTEDIEKIYQAGLAHYGFCQVQSLYLESQITLDKAIRVVRKQTIADTRIAEILAELLVAYAWICIRLGSFQKAQTTAEEGLALYQKHNIVSMTNDTAADPRGALSVLASIRGDYDEALRLSEEARLRAEAQNEAFNLLFSYYTMTSAWLGKGNFEEAHKAAQKGNEIAIAIRADWIRVYIVNDLGQVARALGNFEEAKQYFRTGYQLRMAFNDPEGMAVSLSHLGDIAFLQADYDEARRIYTDSLNLYADLGDRGGLAAVLKGLGQTACAVNNDDDAQKYLRQALETSMDIDFISLTLSILNAIGLFLLRKERYQLGAKLMMITAKHAAADQETRDYANSVLEQFKANLSADAFAKAQAASQNADLGAVNRELLQALA